MWADIMLLLIDMYIDVRIHMCAGYTAEHARAWADIMLLFGLFASVMWAAYANHSRTYKEVRFWSTIKLRLCSN